MRTGDMATPPASTPSPPLSRIGLNAHKAGMEGINKAKINQIILEASKGSKYYENEVRKEQQVTKRVNVMLDNLKKLTLAQIQSALKVVDKEIETLEKTRNLSHIVVHVDMDAFYAAVETKNDPSLKDVPMAVGGYSMLSTSNYLARRYGVRAAMPGFIGKKLCPGLVIVKPHYKQYSLVSRQVREVLKEYDPHFSPVGLDEAYLDLTEYVRRKMEGGSDSLTTTTDGRGSAAEDGGSQIQSDAAEVRQSAGDNIPSNNSSPSKCVGAPKDSAGDHSEPVDTTLRHSSDEEEGEEEDLCRAHSPSHLPRSHWQCAERVVEEIRSQILKATQLTASAGIAPNKMLAKVASDMNKPNGQYCVDPTREGVLQFVQQLPIRKVSGIGKVTERMLNAIGATMCRDLYEHRALLHLLFSSVSSQYFHGISLGIGSTDVHRTFSELSDPVDLQRKCKELCHSLAEDMKREGVKGKTVTLKLKTVTFEVKSRATTVSKFVSTSDALYHAAGELLRLEICSASPNPLRLRLMGVRISSLERDKQDSRQDTLDTFFKRRTHSPTKPRAAGHDILADSCSDNDESIADPSTVLPERLTQVQDSHHDSGEEVETATCPICNRQVPVDNMLFNRHIDECLNYSALSDQSSVSLPPNESHSKAAVTPHDATIIPSGCQSSLTADGPQLPPSQSTTSSSVCSSDTLRTKVKGDVCNTTSIKKLSSASPSPRRGKRKLSQHGSPVSCGKKRFRTLDELFKCKQ